MDRVALIGENSVEYINMLLDIWNCGNSAVLIDWKTPFLTALEMMKEANVKQCIIEKRLIEYKDISSVQGIEFVVFERKDNFAQCLPYDTYDKFQSNYEKNEAVIVYSSGITGKPKGVILSHYAINTNADTIIDYMHLKNYDCIYIANTISHSSTLTGELLVALKTRTKLVIAPTVVPSRFVLNNIEIYKVSIICVNPNLLDMYADEVSRNKYILTSLKTIYVCGSILNDRIYNKAHDVFKDTIIYNVYGLSEAGQLLTIHREDCCNDNSVGKANKNVEIVIVNKQGKRVKNGERGIIHVKTKFLYSGYVARTDGSKSLYKGWLNTGDIGFFDEYGELHIVDRIDDVATIDSHIIYPADIENKILLNCKVKDCVVLIVNCNEENLLCCLYTAETDLTQHIKTSLSTIVMQYENPKLFIRVDCIPRSRNGKVVKREIGKFEINKHLRLLGKCNN